MSIRPAYTIAATTGMLWTIGVTALIYLTRY